MWKLTEPALHQQRRLNFKDQLKDQYQILPLQVSGIQKILSQIAHFF